MDKFDKETRLTELVEYCSAPESIDARTERLKEACSKVPPFKEFLRICFTGAEEFNTLKPVVDTFKIKTVGKKYTKFSNTVPFVSFMVKELKTLKDSSSLKLRVKTSLLIQLLDEMDHEDALLIKQMIKGDFVLNDKINIILVKSTFPEMFIGLK